jgi:5-deoxy-5-amino-3-dehydroquinate synthase
VEELCSGFARAGIGRGSVVVAVGGGVVTDIAGFVAATYHRGLPVVHVPTTLLGQVDAAIGGKTGVNLPEGKNLVGAYWQPAGVCCDTSSLASLPPAEWRSGRGEMVKYAFLGIEELASLPLDEQVARCVALKAEIVASDERDGGRRMILNYGHTLAHALEAASFAGPADDAGGRTTGLRHGEAVAIGLVFAARLAHRLGRIGTERVDRHRALIAAQGLPTDLPPALSGPEARAELLALMRRDKKAGAGLTFVLDGDSGVEVVESVPLEAIEDELAALASASAGGRDEVAAAGAAGSEREGISDG